jgi:hypothetical protein
MTTDAAGRFSFTVGNFDASTQVRAVYDGFASDIQTLKPLCYTCSIYSLYFYLGRPGVAVSLAGDYNLTFAADNACADLPPEVRTRSYPAAVTVVSSGSYPLNTMYTVTAAGARFLPGFESFLLGVAGNDLAFHLEESEGPWLVEELGPTTYVGIGGVGETSIRPGATAFSAPFHGTIEYCEQRSPSPPYYRCATPVIQLRCTSPNHRVTLTRR